MFKLKANINLPILLRVIGLLLLVEAAFLTVPLITCLIYHEADWLPFLITIGITALCGAAMTCIKPASTNMGKREGFLLTALVWIFFSFFGMLPFMLTDNQPLGLSDAFFEAMSGFTTTGVSVMASIKHLSHGMIIWRALMQWIGGMGIILFTLAVIPMLNHSGGMQMFNAEVTGITHDKLRPRVSQTAKGLWLTYIILTLMLTALLWAGPMTLFESVCHGFSTMSTGGFSTEDNSLAAWGSTYVDVVITVFMFLGGVNFALIFRAAHGEFAPVWRNDVFRAYIWIILISWGMFAVAIWCGGNATSWKSLTIDPLFQIVSAITSTGFLLDDFLKWGTFCIALGLFLMFFGACAGSTSGGAKLDRLLVLLKDCRNQIYRCIHPNNIYSVRINAKVVPPDIVGKVVTFLCLYVMIIVVGGLILTAMDVPLVDSFFYAFSSISNTGMGCDLTGYGHSYGLMPSAGKWVLAAIMLTGRLEIFTILILFARPFWKK